VVNGRLDCTIIDYIGPAPVIGGSGEINGIINGVRYGNGIVTYENLITSRNTNMQTGIQGSYKQIIFGGAVSTDEVDLDAAGKLTFKIVGQYRIKVRVQYGRTAAGGASWMFFGALLNGNQVGSSPLVKLDNANSDAPFEEALEFNAIVGDEVTFDFTRDLKGNNSGDLIAETPTDLTREPSPSAVIEVSIIR